MSNAMKKPLTTKTIEMMKPKDFDKADIGEYSGLRVTCGKTGIKTFFYRYSSPITKKLTQVKIGSFPQTSLAEARKQLKELKHIRLAGRCLATELKEFKKEQAQKESQKLFYVKDLVELYLSQYIEDHYSENGRLIVGARKPKGQDEVRRTLYNDVVIPFGDRLASSMTRKEIAEHITNIVNNRGASVQAGSVLREWIAAYRFAIGLDKFDENFVNPALLAKETLKMTTIKLTNNKGTRAFDHRELGIFLKWLKTSRLTEKIQNVFLLTLLTGCRTGEICAIAWDDIDLEMKTIFLRETKTGTSRYVQLSNQTVDLLKTFDRSTKYLFQMRLQEKPIQQKYLTERTWILRKSGAMLDIEHWSPHDLRRTVRTGLARLGCPNEVGEAILGHSKKGIEGTYNLHTYDKECKIWLQKWADYLDDLLTEQK